MMVQKNTMCSCITPILILGNESNILQVHEYMSKAIHIFPKCKPIGFFTDTIMTSQQATCNWLNLPLHNFLTYWKATR